MGVNMADHQQILTVLCPHCCWQSKGADSELLRLEKNRHLTYECPLPSKSAASVFGSNTNQRLVSGTNAQKH